MYDILNKIDNTKDLKKLNIKEKYGSRTNSNS